MTTQTSFSAATIDFTPCTGFGSEGRSATLRDAAGECLGTGYGATDDEAVVEALMDAGLSMGRANDVVGSVIRAARIIRN